MLLQSRTKKSQLYQHCHDQYITHNNCSNSKCPELTCRTSYLRTKSGTASYRNPRAGQFVVINYILEFQHPGAKAPFKFGYVQPSCKFVGKLHLCSAAIRSVGRGNVGCLIPTGTNGACYHSYYREVLSPLQ
jgi:hypothetical protein